MEFTMNHPVLYFLPIVVSFLLHMVISMGLVMEARAGFYRFFVYYASAAFFGVYLLLFNQAATLATTRIAVDYLGKNIYYENQYGALKIPAGNIKGVIVERQKSQVETVWVVTEEQTFYLDGKFSGFLDFLPALGTIVELGEPRYAGAALMYKTRHTPENTSLEIARGDNKLKGDTLYYLPWLLVVPFFAYKLGIKTWLGPNRYLILYILAYGLPLVLLSFIFRPTLIIFLFLVIYPVYLLFLSAACIPEQINLNWVKN